jgi:hypothetical protein
VARKYGADVFENENAVFIFPGNTGAAFFKTRILPASSGPALLLVRQGDISLRAATARSIFRFIRS